MSKLSILCRNCENCKPILNQVNLDDSYDITFECEKGHAVKFEKEANLCEDYKSPYQDCYIGYFSPSIRGDII